MNRFHITRHRPTESHVVPNETTFAMVEVAPAGESWASVLVTWGVATVCLFLSSALIYLALGRSVGFDTVNYEFSSGFGLLTVLGHQVRPCRATTDLS